jgi:hypothetical protein
VLRHGKVSVITKGVGAARAGGHERVTTMQRARRVAFLAVLALVGGLALSGCRSQPNAAIYVGSTSYSQKQVDRLANQFLKLPNSTRAAARTTVAQWLVVRDLGKRLVAEKKWAAPEVDVAGTAEQFQTELQSADPNKAKQMVTDAGPLIKLVAEFAAYSGAVRQHAPPVEPTDADYADLYQRAKAASLVDPSQDEAAFRQGLNPQIAQTFASYLGARKLYTDAIKRANVVINPKYGPAEFAVWQQQSSPLVVIALNAKSSGTAVVPAPQRTQAPAASG